MNTLRLRLLLGLMLAAFGAGQSRLLRAETLPVGTSLEVRLQQPISSYSSHPGMRLTGVIISPVTEGGQILVPLGTTIAGSVVSIRRVGLGLKHETALIDIHFDHIVLKDGQSIPIACRIGEVENSRETIDKQDRIQGIRSTSTISNKASGVIGNLAFGDPIAILFTTAGSASTLRFSEPEISLPAGTELIAQLTAPLDVPHERADTVPPLVTNEAGKADLGRMVRALPFRTITDSKKPKPSDLTNLAFIGTAEDLQHAFAAAGWVTVDALDAQSTYSTIRSVAENQGYQRAPMSILLLDGKAPNYAYAKTLDTFSKRHHLRIWLTKETWNGQPVWTSSSTHDIGIGFSKKNKTFIHLIDTNIDNERAKVVNDLIFTGCVASAQLVTRPWLPPHPKNGTDEDLITDGRIAVLQFNNCSHPNSETQGEDQTVLPIHGNPVERTTRQTVLTLKNNLLRDNVGVTAYSGVRYALDSRKQHKQTVQRNMEIDGQTYTVSDRFVSRDAYEPDAADALPSTPQPRKRKGTRVWKPPSIELGFHGGFHGYYGGNGGAIVFLIDETEAQNTVLTVAMGNTLHDGWELGGTVTLDSQKYFSHEFAYDQSYTGFLLGLEVVGTDTTTNSQVNEFAFQIVGLRTSLASYNFLLNATPRTSRFRPYLAAGPSLQLMHLADAPIKKAPSYFRLGLSTVGLLTAAYDFGGTPPLEGGGIFQPGIVYGGGARYRLTPRWMIRADYRETLTSQPDFWSKSKNDILSNVAVSDGYTLTLVGPFLQGASRQDRITGGISFTF